MVINKIVIVSLCLLLHSTINILNISGQFNIGQTISSDWQKMNRLTLL